MHQLVYIFLSFNVYLSICLCVGIYLFVRIYLEGVKPLYFLKVPENRSWHGPHPPHDMFGSDLHLGRDHLSHPSPNPPVPKRNVETCGSNDRLHVWRPGEPALDHATRKGLRKTGF